MNDLFLLFFIAIIALIIGLIKPGLVIRWGKKKNRGKVLKVYGIMIIAFFFLFVFTIPEEEMTNK